MGLRRGPAGGRVYVACWLDALVGGLVRRMGEWMNERTRDVIRGDRVKRDGRTVITGRLLRNNTAGLNPTSGRVKITTILAVK